MIIRCSGPKLDIAWALGDTIIGYPYFFYCVGLYADLNSIGLAGSKLFLWCFTKLSTVSANTMLQIPDYVKSRVKQKECKLPFNSCRKTVTVGSTSEPKTLITHFSFS